MKNIIFALLFTLTSQVFGQVVTADPDIYTAQQLIEDVLVTGCLQAFNVDYTGPNAAIGYYSGGTLLGFAEDHGLILSTGNVTDCIGPNNSVSITTDFGLPGSPLFNSLTSTQTYDAIILEFDFIPSSDTLKFNYIFASDEYPEYVNSTYNDVFAFFLSGPNPAGGFYSDRNIALIPGTTTAVAINSVNNGYADPGPATGPCENCQYYVDNTTGTEFQFDGYTTPLTATALVTQCETYHIKLAITDVGDGVYDSAVLIAERGFSSGGEVNADHSSSYGGDDHIIYEGCENYWVFAKVDSTFLNDSVYVDINVTGSADNSDLSFFPTSYWLLPGQMSDTIYYTAFIDNITENETFTISILNGCPCDPSFNDYTITIEDNFDLEPTISPDTTICIGDNAVLNATVNPLLDPSLVTYHWNTGETSSSITVSPSSTTTYHVTITHVCANDTVLECAVDPVPCNISISVNSDTLCNGECTDITSTITSQGLPPYTYVWSDSNFSGEGPFNVCPTTTTTYSVTVTDSYGNSGSASGTVVVNTNPTGSISATDIDCYNNNNGALDLAVSNGTAPYQYNWTTSDGSGIVATDEDQTNLGVGAYDVTITDANNCTGTANSSISQPTELTISETHTDITCYQSGDGSIDITVGGGTTPYQYNWTTSDGSGVVATDEDQTNIGAGTYDVTVTDAHNCTITISATIIEPPALTISQTHIDLTCYQSGDGSIDITVGGGTTPYQYNWETSDGSGFVATDEDQTNIGAGTYNVTVTDAHSCTITTSATITEPPALTISEIHTDVACNGGTDGSIDITTGNGTTPYQYNWATSDGSGVVATDEDQTNIGAGTYIVTITDANNCSITKSVEIIEPTALTIGETHINVTCYQGDDGSIDLTVGGGTTPYQYNWTTSNGSGFVASNEDQTNLILGTYDVTVTDAHNCTITTSVEITEPAEILGTDTKDICEGETYSFGTQLLSTAGVYTEVFQSVNGCDSTVTLDFIVNPNPTPTITGNPDICAGDQALLNAGSGYTYNWSTGETSQSINASSAGQYTVEVTDNHGCSGTTNIFVTVDEVIITGSSNQLICYGETATISATPISGVGPYTYYWTPAQGSGSSVTVSPTTGTTYSVYAVDSMGCSSNTEDITVSVSPQVNIDVIANKDTVCPGDPVIISYVPSNGVPPYTVYDSNNNIVDTNNIIEYLNTPTTYSFSVIDNCGSIANDDVTVNIYDIPPLSFSADVLKGCVPLQVHFNVNNEYTFASYNWTLGYGASLSPSPIYIFEETGVYDVSLSVVTQDGCSAQHTILQMISVYPNPKAKFEAIPDVVSIINPTVGFDNYSEDNLFNFWNFDDGDSSGVVEPVHKFKGIGKHNVVLIVQNQYGCVDSVKHMVVVQDIFTLYAPTAFSPDGDDINDGFKVVGHGIDLDNFTLRVYDRWGELIWDSIDLYEIWDGTVKGDNRIAQNDTYKWVVVCKDFNGVEHTKSGNVTLIR